MGRKKRNGVTKEELNFEETPKSVYHKLPSPILCSCNPITLNVVSIGQVCTKWVSSDFIGNGPEAFQSRCRLGRSRKQHNDDKLSRVLSPNHDIFDTRRDTTNVVAATHKKHLKYKALSFSKSEGVSQDGSIVESLRIVESLSGNLCTEVNNRVEANSNVVVFDATSSDKSEVCTPVKKCQAPNLQNNESYQCISEGGTLNYSKEEFTFLNFLPEEIYTPDVSNIGDVPVVQKHQILNTLSLDDKDCSSNCTITTSIKNNNCIAIETAQRGPIDNNQPSPLEKHRFIVADLLPNNAYKMQVNSSCFNGSSAEHLLPSLARNPLPLFLSANSLDSNLNEINNSAELFKNQFFDTNSTPIQTARPRFLMKDFTNSCTPIGYGGKGRKDFLKSVEKQMCNDTKCQLNILIENVTNNDCREQDFQVFADDTPESEYGLPYRLRQLKEHPRVLSLVSRAARKILAT